MTAKEKLMKTDREWLIYIPLIIVVAVCMAFSDDRQISHLPVMAFVWSVLIIMTGRIRLGIGDGLIFFGMMTFMLGYRGWIFESIAFALLVLFTYQIGKILAGYDMPVSGGREEAEGRAYERVMFAVVTLAITLFIRALLNYSFVPRWRKSLNAFTLKIRIKDIFGESLLRTQQAFFLVLIGCTLILWIYLLRKNIVIAITGMILSIMAMVLELNTKGRIVTCCSIVALCASLFAYIIAEKLYKKRWLQIVGAVLVLGLIAVLIAVRQNVGGLYDRYMDSFWSDDGGIFHNIRFTLMKRAIVMLKDYPFGGNFEPLYVGKTGNVLNGAHNSWLDIGKYSGIIPLVLTVGFTVTNIISLFRVWLKGVSGYKYVLISAFTGVFLYNMFESGIFVRIIFWTTLVFFGGMADGLGGRLKPHRELEVKLRDDGYAA